MRVRMTVPMARRQQAEVNGRLVQFTRLECAVLMTMLLRQGYDTSRDDLISILYDNGECEPDSAQTNIRCLVWRINRKAGGRLIWAEHTRGYFIDLEVERSGQRQQVA